MKILGVPIIIMGLCASMVLAHTGTAQDLLNRKMSLKVKNKPIMTVLKQIEQTQKVRFSYLPELIRPIGDVSIESKDESLGVILNRLLSPHQLKFSVSGAYIILKRVEQVNNHQRTWLLDEIKVRGKVTDDQGEELPGVSILLKGTQRGTTTDANGDFTINVPDQSAVFIFSYVGYKQQEVSVGNKSELQITMEADYKALDEIVVIGYGSVKKSDMTGAVSSIKVAEMQEAPIASLDQGLAGRAAGVQVTQTSGMPGAIASIRIRGTSSLQGGNEPLYVIDGVPVYSGSGFGDTGGSARISPLSTINPSDIASMEILKDASSTAIYGARAANGVVLITTKSGENGKDAISIDSYYGWQSVRHKIPVMDGQSYAQLVNEAYTNDGLNAPFTADVIAAIPNNGHGTDWQDELFRTAPIQNHQLSFSGGDKKTTYAVSFNFLDQIGIIKGSDLSRVGTRINLSRKITEQFKIGTHLTLSRTNAHTVDTDSGGELGVVTGALKFNPMLPVYQSDGSYTYVNTPGNLYPNPIATVNEQKRKNSTTRLLGDASAEWQIVPGLVGKVMFGLDYFATKGNSYIPSTLYQSSGLAVGTISDNTYTNWLNENTLNYVKEFNKNHSVNVVAGVTFQKNVSQYLMASSQGFVNDLLQDNNLGTGSIYNKPGSSQTQWSMRSYLARANYNLMGKYLFTLSGRYDGSSRFGENNKNAFFPSAAFAWRLADEDFISKLNLFSDLKARASMGATGNQEIGLYSSLPTLSSGNYTIGRTIRPAFYSVGIPNPNLKWEKTTQYDAGIDFGFFNNRLIFTADYYLKRTNDLIYNISIPSVSGFNTSLQNIGSIKNYGLEFSMDARIIEKMFKWSTSFNISFNRNKVLSLGSEQYKDVGTGDGHLKTGSIHRLIVGQPIGLFYGYVFDGVYQNQSEVDQGPQGSTSYVGGKRYKDLSGPNGVPDGVIDATYDRAVIGNPNPKAYGGMTNKLSYKGWELLIFNQFSYGNTLFNMNAMELGLPSASQNVYADLANRWTPTHSSQIYGKATTNRAAVVSDQFMEDGSFIKLKTMTVSYRFKKQLIPGIKNLQCYATGQNLLTFTKYTGYDPEVSYRGASNLEMGEDFGGYPSSKTFLLGVRIGL